MKTNHRRGFKAKRPKKSHGFGIVTTLALSGKVIGAGVGYNFSKGNRGMAKARHGAKKYVRSRERFHENAATKRLAEAVD